MADITIPVTLKTRYDTFENWSKTTTSGAGANRVLDSGELAVCYVPSSGSADPVILFKVGNGTSTFAQLPWGSALASDVYDWAKAATKPTYTKAEIGLGNVDNTKDADKPVSTAQAAAINAKYSKPSGGIPKTDLASAVQTSLSKADTALQSVPDTYAKKTDIPTIPTKVSSFTNDSGYLTLNTLPKYDGGVE